MLESANVPTAVARHGDGAIAVTAAITSGKTNNSEAPSSALAPNALPTPTPSAPAISVVEIAAITSSAQPIATAPPTRSPYEAKVPPDQNTAAMTPSTRTT